MINQKTYTSEEAFLKAALQDGIHWNVTEDFVNDGLIGLHIVRCTEAEIKERILQCASRLAPAHPDTQEKVAASVPAEPDTQELPASVPAYPLNTYSDGYKAAMEDGKPVEVATLRTLTHILNNRIEALEKQVEHLAPYEPTHLPEVSGFFVESDGYVRVMWKYPQPASRQEGEQTMSNAEVQAETVSDPYMAREFHLNDVEAALISDVSGMKRQIEALEKQVKAFFDDDDEASRPNPDTICGHHKGFLKPTANQPADKKE